MGVGSKFIAGKQKNELAIAVYVHKKLPLNALTPEQVIPSEIEGIPTDVEETPVAECLTMPAVRLGGRYHFQVRR